jgi:DNA (cytosine-5)-methyltransferase 1
MTRNGTAYQLQPLAPLTRGIGSGSSPIPEGNGLWPTPTGSVAQLGEKPETWLARRAEVKERVKNGNGMGMPLTIAAQMWPTPTAVTDTGGAALCKWGGAGARRKLRKLVSSEELNGALNPTWVEWLMGFPLGWTDLGVSGTLLSPKSQSGSDGGS